MSVSAIIACKRCPAERARRALEAMRYPKPKKKARHKAGPRSIF
jgi:hypothetical protein